MQIKLKQLSFANIYSNIDEYFQQDKPKLIELFEQYIDLSALIPQRFLYHYHASTGLMPTFSLCRYFYIVSF